MRSREGGQGERGDVKKYRNGVVAAGTNERGHVKDERNPID